MLVSIVEKNIDNSFNNVQFEPLTAIVAICGRKTICAHALLGKIIHSVHAALKLA